MNKKYLKEILVLFFIFFGLISYIQAAWCSNGKSCEVVDSCDSTCCTHQDNFYCESEDYWNNCVYDNRGLCVYPSCTSCSCGCNSSTGTCCNPGCTPPACWNGTSTSDTGDYYGAQQCTDDCGDKEYRNCYCNICTPPSCLSSGYSDTNLGYGQVPLAKTPSCRNGYNAPDYISQCDMTYRTCYCPSCLKQCPSPLANTGSANLILNDFRECTNDCDVKPPEDQDDCYETESSQPTEVLTIVKNPLDYTNLYGFSSITHTGDRQVETARLGTLNDPFNPPVKMKAEYTDTNGSSDIEGLFVWFRESQYTGELGTPLYISDIAEPTASANDSWGFMLRRMGSAWQPYVPSYNGGNVFWTREDTSGNIFSIDGPNGGKMVEVTIIGDIIETGNTVSMEFSLRFSNSDGVLYDDPVAEGEYNIYLMGLDKFSFTPYDNYNINYGDYWTPQFKYSGYTDLSPFWQPNQLRYKPEQGQTYVRNWTNTGKTWTIDRKSPTLNTNVTVSGNSITLSWDASDDRNLYAIVGNIFTSGDDVKTITVSTGTIGVSLHDPTTFSLNSKDNGVDEDKIGILNRMDVSLFQVNPNINGTEHSGSVTLNINHEAQNSLYFFITVFDDAGNIAQSEEIKQDLNDWMVTSGGLAYSAGGTSFTVKDLDGVVWGGTLPPSNYEGNPGLIPPNVNLTSEMWGENSDYPIYFLPRSPLNSYSLSRFTGIKLEKDNYYTLLLDSYEKNKKNLGNNVKEIGISGNLSGAVTNYCSDAEYCVFESIDGVDSISINSNFVCNKKTLMFINGNLTINPPLKNATDIDTLSKINGCIFVVSGNVSIGRGVNASTGSIGYDKVNGYILADGQIIIKDETNKRVPNTDPIIDGVYINGGLQSLGSNKSIVFNRYLRLQDRVKFPLLAIDLHPKYGILGEKFFGSKYIIQIIELGVKP